jgi:hypothetical protein
MTWPRDGQLSKSSQNYIFAAPISSSAVSVLDTSYSAGSLDLKSSPNQRDSGNWATAE